MRKVLLVSSLIVTVVFLLTLFLWKDIYITLNGNQNITMNIYGDYQEEGFNASYCTKLFKFNCKNVSEKVEISNNIDSNALGDYQIIYEIKYKNIKKQSIRNIKVADLEPPSITLNYNENIATCPNTKYEEEGFEVTDNYDKDLKGKTIIEEKDGKVYYKVSDSSNNEITTIRNIKYGDKENPTITLKGYQTEYVLLGTDYIEKGYTASDNCDGNLTDKVTVTSNIDKNKTGTYKVVYSVSDTNGNVTTIEREIKIYKKQSYTTIVPTGKVIYLTFDDGPCVYTKKLLDILKEYNVKATFFVTNQMSGYNSYIKREYDEGHAIGIHTYSHSYKTIYSSIDAFFNDVNKMDNIIYKQTGIHTKLLRFAGGSSNTISGFNKGIMTSLAKETSIRGYIYFDWNVESNDTGTSNPDKIANKIINGIKAHNYSIVLQHDIKSYTASAVEKVIQYGLANGYTFLPLDTSSPTAHHGINN